MRQSNALNKKNALHGLCINPNRGSLCRLVLLSLFGFMVLFLGSKGFSQTAQGFTGLVTDPSGAVVGTPGSLS